MNRKWGFLAIVLALSPGCARADQPPSLQPAMTGPLALDANPYFYNVPDFGKIYFSGAVTGLAMAQSHPVPSNIHSTGDWGNGQFMVQKAEGLFQFYVQGGIYSTPVLGTPYARASGLTENAYNYVPEAFVKLAPADNFSIEAGKLPTLFGSEYTFTFENMNIERGLVWNQENDIDRGVQLNYTAGPVAFNLSWNDGFYSDKYNWLTGLATWTINSSNALAFAAGGNLGHTSRNDFVTPLPQDNSDIYDLMYTWTSGPWTMSPYLQYTYVPGDATLGLLDSASTFGAAVLGKYAFNSNWSLAGRVEYENANGSSTAPNLLYGPNSKAWSATITPTYQQGIWFGRVEGSYVHAGDIAAGDAFGSSGDDRAQARLMLEAGSLF